jgi:hypothetical protein
VINGQVLPSESPSAAPRENPPARPDRLQEYLEVLDLLGEEEYERCASRACGLIRRDSADRPLAPYLAFLKYFKLFADAYRVWQISYHYTEIRDLFRLASFFLDRDTKELGGCTSETADIVAALGHLTRMVCAYTWCENSFINNDPFALITYAERALSEERAALRLLRRFGGSSDPFFDGIAKWLVRYLKCNRLLHLGLSSCARMYADVLEKKPLDERTYRRRMRRAEAVGARLLPLSAELFSELNAHIRHIRSHYSRVGVARCPADAIPVTKGVVPPAASPSDRRAGGPPTWLRVANGKLVLCMSAGCDDSMVRRLLENERLLLPTLKEAYANSGYKLEGARKPPMQDIFETSFGKARLRCFAFDLGFVEISFLDNGSHDRFRFQISAEMSALGVCTVRFTLDLADLGDSASVEKVRAIQSCICPHAGQVGLRLDAGTKGGAGERLQGPVRHVRGDRPLQVAEILAVIASIEDYLLGGVAGAAGASLLSAAVPLRDLLVARCEKILVGESDWGWDDFSRDRGLFEKELSELRGALRRAVADPSEAVRDKAKSWELRLTHACDSVARLTTVAVEILQILGSVLQPERSSSNGPGWSGRASKFSPARRTWILAPDTGWSSYIHVRRIDEVEWSGRVVREAVGFEEISGHPDTVGFVIEQREARASFDDWRFMSPRAAEQENLALIRSHTTDAFFGSEYQAFLYFPDDPQFLTDQYEATVRLMLTLATVLRYWTALTANLSKRSRRALRRLRESSGRRREPGSNGRGERGSPRARDSQPLSLKEKIARLQVILKQLRELRASAGEMKSLIARAGMSRYKDHGDLMRKILSRMKADSAVDLLEDRLSMLEDVHKDVLAEIADIRAREDQTREQGLMVRLMLATVVVTAPAAIIIVEQIAKIDPINTWLSGQFPKVRGLDGDAWQAIGSLAFLALLIAAALVLLGRKKKSE